jgi:hypothetical protein
MLIMTTFCLVVASPPGREDDLLRKLEPSAIFTVGNSTAPAANSSPWFTHALGLFRTAVAEAHNTEIQIGGEISEKAISCVKALDVWSAGAPGLVNHTFLRGKASLDASPVMVWEVYSRFCAVYCGIHSENFRAT